jgi:hypothetical protein
VVIGDHHVPARWVARQVARQRRRTFVAFWFEALAISVSVCFHDASKASTEEVHMNIHSTIGQKLMLCAAAAAAGNRALLG